MGNTCWKLTLKKKVCCIVIQIKTLFFHFQADKVDAQLHTLLIKVEPQVGTILKVSDY